MTDIVLTPITSGYNLSKINANFAKVQDVVNNDVLHNIGGNNVMHQQLDMNFFRILNVFTDVNDPYSLLTIGVADARYYNVSGDTLTGQMNANGQRIVGLPAPVALTEPMRLADVLAIDSGNALQLKVDLADPTNPLNGAAMVARSVVSVASITDLLTTKRDASQTVLVNAYYGGVYALASPTAGDIGQGMFRWSPNVPKSSHNGGTVISPTVPWNGLQATLGAFLAGTGETAPGTNGCFVREFTGPTSVRWFGAVGDNVVNDYEALMRTHLYGRQIHYPAGSYRISAVGGVQTLPGTTVTGEGSGRFSGIFQKSKTTVRNDQVGGGVFWYTTDSTTVQKEALRIFSMELIADNAVQMNPVTGTVAEGVASNIPYLMKFVMEDCSLSPLTVGTGIGCALTKVFDGRISQCDFRAFGTQLLLQGCDLNVVQNNRFTLVYGYAILELGVLTFGSQNLITLNDFVTASSVGAVFFKSTARHVRFINNYLEQGSGGVGTCQGFIDLSATGVPTYGSNGPSSTRLQSVIVEQNRIDGHSLATSFIYRYEPVGVSAKIHDVGTSGPLSALSWLRIEGEELPLFFNVVNACQYDFVGGGQINSKWGGFKTGYLSQGVGSVGFNAMSLLSLNQSELRGNANDQKVKLTPRGFVLKPTLTTTFNCILPTVDTVADNTWLKNGVTYNVTVVARAKTGNPTLRIAKLVNLAVQGTVIDTVLGTQDSVIKFTMLGTLVTDKVGLGFRPVGGVDDIEVSSVSFQAV